MLSRNRWILSSLAGLFLAAATGLALAAASEEAAAGVNKAAAGEANPVRRSEIKLILDHDGSAEHLALANLHEMAVGESRTLATESGTPVVVTRDADGFEIDLAGTKIRLGDHLEADGPGTFHKRTVVLHDTEGENGASNVVMVHKRSADGHAFAFATDGGELPAIPLPIEAILRRLEGSAKFQSLDAATRATVLEALRESAPKAGAFVAGEPGTRTMVLEIEDEDDAGDPN